MSLGVKIKKKLKMFRPLILSRHPSHSPLRARTQNLQLLPFRSVIRFGSTTEVDTSKYQVEINSINSIKNSSSKLLMKKCFIKAGVKTPLMFDGQGTLENWAENKYPIVAKSYFGSKGNGNTLIKSIEELSAHKSKHGTSGYIYEVYMNYAHEFRLHVTAAGCFYACRKALKSNVSKDEAWHRHDTTCVWFLESNELFHKPSNWNEIVNECVKALKSIDADLLCFDVRVQSPVDSEGKKRNSQDFVIIECNSAPSMDNGTKELSFCAKSYISEIPKLLIRKKNGWYKI